MKYALLIIAAIFCIGADGCGPPEADMELQKSKQIVEKVSQRFSITRVGIFRDELAYANTRGIYILIDNETKREYIGISGIGISTLYNIDDGEVNTQYDN